MKSDMIAVPINENSILIEHYLFLYITASFIQDLTNRTIPLEKFVHDIQNIKSIWIKPLKNSNYYEILLPESIVLCTLGKQSIEFNGIYEKSIRNHAEFIKDGIAIGLNSEVIVINQQSILNKQVSNNCRQDERYMEETIKHIVDTLNFISDQKQNIDVQVNYKLYEVEFENWMSAYDQSTTHQLETNIISQPQIKYIKVTSDEFEPFTLSFYIDSILPFSFNYDHIFYIKTINNGWINAVLHERYTDGNTNVVVLQFNRQLSASDLHMQGHIYLMVDQDQHNNQSTHIYYSQLHSDNVLKALLSNQLDDQVEDTNHIKIQSTFDFSEEQQHIISQALLAKQLYYIDGAVTTGKTEILKYIKQCYEKENVRVLHITSQHQNKGDEKVFRFGQLDNNIETLKINSLQALDKFESLILTDKKLLTSYSSDSLDLELAEAEHKNLTQFLQQHYLKIKQNYITPLKEMLDEFTKNVKLLETLYNDILRDEKKLDQQMGKNEFSRWLTLPVLINLQAKIKKNYAKYVVVTNKQKIVTQTYNEMSIKLKETLADEQLNRKKEMWEAQRNHIEHLKSKLLKPFYLDSIRLRTYTSKNQHMNLNKDDYFMLINQLEQLHIALRQYRQVLLRKHNNLFYSYLLKERHSITISMQCLHQHFSMFENQFDIVIIDDAHTFTALELFLAISLGKKAIVAGEKKRTYVSTLQSCGIIDILSTSPALYKKSGAQLLANLLPSTLQSELPHLYRVFPALTCVYHNFILHEDLKLKNRTDLRKIEVLPSVTNPIVLFTTSQTKHRFEHAISKDDIYNHCEAAAIVDLIVSMLYLNEKEERDSNTKNKVKLMPEDILVTSFFSMQVDYIRTQLRYVAPALTIETIHSMVRPITACIGVEKKIVLLSMCVSNKQSSGNRELKQLRQSHLWNIVLSRAQHQLLLIGDIDYIKGSICNEKRQIEDAEIALNMTSYEVANMMKSLVKLAADGDVQFVSLERYTKKSGEINGGFGYEYTNY